jgi:dTDP-4-amino-4,6-dideoxygalactose transaminase
LFKDGIDNLEKLNINEIEILHQKRNKFMNLLHEKGIMTVPGSTSVHNTSYYFKKYRIAPLKFKNSFIASKLSIALPLFPQMSEEEQQFVIENVKTIIKKL